MRERICPCCDALIPGSLGKIRHGKKYCSPRCQRRAYGTGLRFDGLPFPGLHDTELCADTSGCERMAVTRDLCFKHWQKGRYNGDLPPIFVRSRGEHRLINADPLARLADCSTCGPRVRYYHKGSAAVCARSSGATTRKGLYGITDAQYDYMLIRQGNRCGLCLRSPEGRTQHGQLVVDHCHATNIVRVLLCDRCNQALGLFEDDPETLKRALALVQQPRP